MTWARLPFTSRSIRFDLTLTSVRPNRHRPNSTMFSSCRQGAWRHFEESGTEWHQQVLMANGGERFASTLGDEERANALERSPCCSHGLLRHRQADPLAGFAFIGFFQRAGVE